MWSDETHFRFSCPLSLDQLGCQENQTPTPARGKGLPLWKQTDCVWGVCLSQWKTLLITSRNWLYLPDQQQRMPLNTHTHTHSHMKRIGSSWRIQPELKIEFFNIHGNTFKETSALFITNVGARNLEVITGIQFNASDPHLAFSSLQCSVFQ